MFIRVHLNHMNLMHVFQPQFSKIHFNMASHLCVSFPEVLFHSQSPTKFCNISHPDAAIVVTHLVLLDFIIVIIFEKYKL
jgi:hypothetical protein